MEKKKNRNLSPKIDTEKLTLNPFSSSLVIPIVSRTLKGHYKLDEDGVTLSVEIDMEYTPYCKLYSKKEHRLIINHLKPCSKELLFWLIYTISYGKDYLWLDKSRYMKECEVSLNTYKKSKEELIRYGFIIPTGIYKDVYWINPEFFFKGDRIKKYPDKIKEFIPKSKI